MADHLRRLHFITVTALNLMLICNLHHIVREAIEIELDLYNTNREGGFSLKMFRT
jgi:hypothetical protein